MGSRDVVCLSQYRSSTDSTRCTVGTQNAPLEAIWSATTTGAASPSRKKTFPYQILGVKTSLAETKRANATATLPLKGTDSEDPPA